MDAKALQDAVMAFNRLQSENNDSAANDLEPAQERIRALLAGQALTRGLTRWAIETQPDVRRLRNRLDDWDNYGAAETSASDRARAMRPDVLELMRWRDGTAISMGAANYVQAVLAADGLSVTALRERLNAYSAAHLDAVAARTGGMPMERWFDWLNAQGAIESPCEPVSLLTAFARRLGLEWVLSRIDVRSTGSFCFASMVDEGKIRLHIAPVRHVRAWSTLFHEFGHACVYASLPPHALPWLSPLVDEALAVLFENAAIRLLAPEPLRTRALEMAHTEYTRACVSALYELDLWEKPREAEALYVRWYRRLGVRVQPECWALDSFRSIDCMTILAYPIGQAMADGVSDAQLAQGLPIWARDAAETTLADLMVRVR